MDDHEVDVDDVDGRLWNVAHLRLEMPRRYPICRSAMGVIRLSLFSPARFLAVFGPNAAHKPPARGFCVRFLDCLACPALA